MIDAKLNVLESVPDLAAFGGLVEVGLRDKSGEALVHALPTHGGRAHDHRRGGGGSDPSPAPLVLLPLFVVLVPIIVFLAAREPDPSQGIY